jgi:hypothetical protein
MTDSMETELTKLFDDSRVESDDFQRVRMAARAADAVPGPEAGVPLRFVTWVGAIALWGFMMVLMAPPTKNATPAQSAATWTELDQAVGTYLDVGWDDGSLWASPLEGAGAGLSEEAVLEEYAALINEMDL